MNGRPAGSVATTVAWVVVTLLAIAIAAYAILGAFGTIRLAPFVAESPNPGAFFLHMLGGGVALLLGPWQFRPGWRGARSAAHRWIGRGYLTAVLVSGVTGLWLAQYAQAGIVAVLGFGALAVAWLATGSLAYLRVRAHRYQEHRQWMVRNYALTLAAVTLRIYLPLAMGNGIPFETAYPIIAWAAWVPNLLVAEWWLGRRPSRAVVLG